MTTMTQWARNEIDLACKKEKPDWDGKSFDYGCACYQSALKAYECLMEEGHSGFSFSCTKNILMRLCDGLPLLPITENDFNLDDPDADRKHLQCKRYFSLFREVNDGKVCYNDIDRVISKDIEQPNGVGYTFGGDWKIVNELFPITMPYMPVVEKYRVYTRTFKVNGKFNPIDVRHVSYLTTPEGEKVVVDKFFKEKDGSGFKEITREEYEKLLPLRLDPVCKKAADEITTILTNYENCWSNDKYSKHIQRLTSLCKVFENDYSLNTFHNRKVICHGEGEEFDTLISGNSELIGLANFIAEMKFIYSETQKND